MASLRIFFSLSLFPAPAPCPTGSGQSTREQPDDPVAGLVINLRVIELDVQAPNDLIPLLLVVPSPKVMKSSRCQLLSDSSQLTHQPSHLLTLQPLEPLRMRGIHHLVVRWVLSLQLFGEISSLDIDLIQRVSPHGTDVVDELPIVAQLELLTDILHDVLLFRQTLRAVPLLHERHLELTVTDL
jgi:hypothetical protein